MITQLLTTTIKRYCASQSSEVNTIEQNYMINSMLESINDSIGKDEKTDEEIKTIVESLLTTSNLNSYFFSAKAYYSDYIETLKRDFEKKEHNKFWMNLASNLLSSFIYSILVALIIWLGRDSLGDFIHNIFTKK